MDEHDPLFISSPQNPQVKQLIHLRERHERDQTKLFVIEGYRELLRATDAGWADANYLFVRNFF